ncbi:MAG TPA: transcriptional regulator [Prolixibacteraceae bacterium]|nr:transcriptional regulator [Prolixibacteraceae bacterium]
MNIYIGGITMTIHIIKTDEEYEKVLMRIEQIMDAEPNTPEGDELELLSLLVEKYEKETYPLPEADPVDVIQYYMEQRGLKAKDLVGIIGDKAIVSKIMNRERKLNLKMVRNLHQKINIPYHLLMNEY